MSFSNKSSKTVTKDSLISLINKPKTRRGKRAQEKKAPKIQEVVKNALLMRSASGSDITHSLLRDLYMIKKPDALHFTKKNEIRPFESSEGSLEFLTSKNDTPLFSITSHNKKRPHNIIFGRMFNYKLLDMVEFGVEGYIPLMAFKGIKSTLGSKPMLLFHGDDWENHENAKKLKNLFVDWFRGIVVNSINLIGLDRVIVFTILPTTQRVLFRQYAVEFKKSGGRVPAVDLNEMGPRFDLVPRRTRYAPLSEFKAACKIPKALKRKLAKNIEYEAGGEKVGRIHMVRQNLDTMATRKFKAFKNPMDISTNEKDNDNE